MSLVSDIFDRLPGADGGFRRRFSSGILFSLIALVGIFWFPGIPPLMESISDAVRAVNAEWNLLQSIGFSIILFGIIFVIGNLLEVVSDVFLRPFFSLFGGRLAYRGVMQTFPFSLLRNKESASPFCQHYADFEQLPSVVRGGLDNPYGRQFSIAFRYMIFLAPDDEKSWLQQLDVRNKNLFSVLSTVFVSVLFVLSLTVIVGSETDKFNLGSQEARQCYLSVVQKLEGEEYYVRDLVERGLFEFNFSKVITEEDGRSVRLLETLFEDIQLYIRSMSERSNDIEKTGGGHLTRLKELTGEYWNCRSIESSEVAPSRYSADALFYMFVSVFVFLFLLGMTHAVTVRNSVESALDILQLRGVSRRNEEAGTANDTSSDEDHSS